MAASSARANFNTWPPVRAWQHSEFNPSKTEPLRLLQIWIQPDVKGVKPRYAEKNFATAPTGKLNLVASKSGRDGSIAIHQDADCRSRNWTPGRKFPSRSRWDGTRGFTVPRARWK